MSSASRKVKNPLLSAAGDGFAFENYVENSLLVPVTPAVLRNDAEPDNFVGQKSVDSRTSTPPVNADSKDTEFTPIPLIPEGAKATENQPAKQGYFTSILSSLPNLSLSTITGDSPGTQATREFESVTGVENQNPYVPSYDSRDTLKDTPSPVIPSFHEPRRTNFLGSGEVQPGNTLNLPTPPQPTLPPTIPASTDGSISYRLGNQRRLKYALPPDLTTSAPKPFPAPAVPPLFAPQSVPTSTIFNPNEHVVSAPSQQPIEAPISTNPPSLQHSTPEQLSQANSLQESIRSSPTTTVAHSLSVTPRSVTPQSQNSAQESIHFPGKPAFPKSSSRPIPSQVPEPATPQNTPANISFSGFDLYANHRDFLTTHDSGKQPATADNTASNQPDLRIFKESVAAPVETKTNPTFAPISAVQVTEKLEHLLAELKEDSPEIKSQGNIIETQAVEASTDRKSNDLSKSDSLTDVILNQEDSVQSRPTSVSQEPQATCENINESQSHDLPSYVPSFQQYFQTQPLASGFDFFEKPPAGEKSNLSYVSEGIAHAQSVRSPQHKETIDNTHVDLASAFSTNDLQQPPPSVPFDISFGSHPVSAPQVSWQAIENPRTETVGVTCSESVQSEPPPLFYNPAQFKNDFLNPSPARRPFVQPPTSQPQQYFENLSGSLQVQDIAAGINNIFLPTSPVTTLVPEPTGLATLSPVQMSINSQTGRSTTDTVPLSFQNLAIGSTDKRMQYRAVYHHWFYRKEVEHKVLWLPFSMQDSLRLEEVHNSPEITPETTVATDGGRYDVDILRRQRTSVYWSGVSTEVRRCSWFFKGPTESKYIPYDESTAVKLEEEYKHACLTNMWNRRIDLNNGEYIIFHSATVQIHYSIPSSPELAASWGNSSGSEDSTYLQGAGSRPRVLKRGLDEFHIEDGEPEKVDHLLFLVHGIGSVCDLKFRTVEEVVDEFRNISLQLVQSHYRSASEQRVVNRIEVLPISWHTTLHSEDTGIDKKLRAITLESIPKLRHFTNDTLLDILFYTSPVYCQTIMQTVGSEMSRLYALFKERNPDFNGGIYLGGHSLGSLILFDLLCHQKPLPDDKSNINDAEANEEQKEEDTDPSKTLPNRVLKRRLSKKISYVIGAAGTGQPYIHYPQLNFHPRAFFALGSPIGMFVTVRGIDMLGEDFLLPTCPAFFNIFHPFDPVAYRVESLINPEACKYRPMLIPHHKGRKRMHLELKETMARVGADLKQKILDSVRSTWNSVYQLAVFHKPDNSVLEREIDKVVEEQLQQTPTVPEQQSNDDGGADFKVGRLNGGRRIDYVLQEAPFEYINEYIFALTSHVCYWESEDTMLMILKEIYGSTGIQTDAQLPQQTLSIERLSPSPSSISLASTSTKNDAVSTIPVVGIDPITPILEKPVGPPPKSGFVKKS
ncbi:SEC23-interacting protein isoform X1 [Colletes gigas]|uniref:SEC23-interacting protein isoform X1 n=1 Tax=Colletes gigas TaxID=935657 RepID=UPI001C9A3976|nr:SEC23-interacting protein isoform X1 [Colletes gigas]